MARRTTSKRASRPGPSGSSTARRLEFSPRKWLLAAGALTGAVASIIGLGSTVYGWFDGKSTKTKPEAAAGTIRSMKIQKVVTPYTFRQWRARDENSVRTSEPEAHLRQPGALINYDIKTRHFRENTDLQLRVILTDLTQPQSIPFPGRGIRITAGQDCGCSTWVPIDHPQHRYSIELGVYPPGPIRPGQEPWKKDTMTFSGGA